MRLTKSIAVLVASVGAFAFAQTAIAQFAPTWFIPTPPQGKVSFKSDPTPGNFIVERQVPLADVDTYDIELYSLSEGDELFLDDVIVTTTEEVTAEVEFYQDAGPDCSIRLPSLSKFKVTQQPCIETPTPLEPTEIASYTSASVAGPAGSGPGAAVFGVPATLGGLAAAAAANNDDGNGTPASPG